MARITDENNRQALAAAEAWKRSCLIEDGSVFSKETLWTLQNLNEFSRRFVENFREGKEGFFTKLSGQLSGSKPEIPKLVAEMLWVLFIFPTRMTGEKKRQEVSEVWSWSGDKLDPSLPLLVSGTEGGIGYPGTAYNTHRFRELSFFIRAMQSWKALSAEDRGSLLGAPWRFGVWLDSIEDSAKRQFRHILVYLLFPDNYERIASKKHKALILSEFASYLSDYQSIPEVPAGSRTADDHKILQIRKRLEGESPNKEVDFYWTPWREVWLEEDEEDEGRQNEIKEEAGPRRYWIEKCRVQGRIDRETGEHALGRALWSPQTSSDGKNIYAAMREVRAGDVVLHLVDNDAIKGVSLAAGSFDDRFVGLTGTDWAGRPAYRVPLRDYQELDPSLTRSDFLGNSEYESLLKDIASKYRKVFFNRNLELNEGSYLTEAPKELVAIINDAYRHKSGQGLPLIPADLRAGAVGQWIFQANPKLFEIDSALQSLPQVRWLVKQHASKIKVGDRVYIWRSGEESGVIAIGTVSSEPALAAQGPEEAKFALEPEKFGGRKLSVSVQIDRVLPEAVSREDIRKDPALTNLSILRAPQGTNFPVTTQEAEAIEALIRVAETGGAPLPASPPYTIEEFARESRFLVPTLRKWQDRLLRKKHIVLQGPPGTGKTYVAERLARTLVSGTTGFVETVQFHPSYAYEDFIQGIRPDIAEGQLTFDVRPGRFLEFCKIAEKRGDAPCVLIIDEINRANLSRVFGELMYLLEYRDKTVPLATSGTEFRVPGNVYVIGTMNTADRSIALVDHALRRRFSFIYVAPDYGVLRSHLEDLELPADGLVEALRRVNAAINDRNYEVGISFFLSDGADLKGSLPAIWEGEIEPYLEEFFFDQPDKVEDLRWDNLKKGPLSDWV